MSKMEKITSHQVLDLMEAYQSVYVPQEDLNEELIWEEVEFWVNSLVEEGYDLSEYSWEEMYESYLEEQGGRRGSGSNPSQTNQSVSGSQIGSAMRSVGNVLAYGNAQGTRPTTQSRQTNVRGGGTNPPPASTAKPAPTSGNYQSRFAGARDSAFARAQNIKGSPVVGPRPAAAAPAARPSAAPARPVARPSAPTAPRPAAAPARPTGTPVRPAAAAPVTTARPSAAPTRPAAAAPVTVARPAAPTMGNPPLAPKPLPPIMGKPSLASQAAEIRAMRQRSQQRTIAQGGTPATALVQSFDPFDVVLGHLIDEGYADNEESALQIMTNMSEEWREDILDEAMMDGPRKDKMIAKQHSPYASSRDRATAFNVGVRDERPRDKKSTGGKGERYSDFGDRGAGNKSRRRRGLEPIRGNTRKE
jgi:hypothetical protein